MTFDPNAIRAFEHAGWEKAAPDYVATFAAATAEYVEPLLDAASFGSGDNLLDLCCGPGHVAAAAAARGATAQGLDFSLAMVGLARRRNPALAFRDGLAEKMPLGDATMDAVVSNFGIHHVAHPALAVAEACRTLKPGRRFAFTTWAAPAENIAWRLLFDAIDLYGDRNAANAPPSGGGLASEEAVSRLFRESGFTDIGVTTLHREWRLARPGDLISALRRGTVRTAALIEAQRPAALLAIEAEIARQAAAYRRDGWYEIPIAAILGHGAKPQSA